MSDTKFTEGPWIQRYSDRITTSDDINGTKSICHVYETAKTSGNRKANLSLIAAAPDMYEAIEYALGVLWQHNLDHVSGMAERSVFDKLQAARAKARGETA